MSQTAARALSWLHGFENALITVLVLLLVLLAGAQIVLRNAFGTSISWADPLLRALVLWTALLGALHEALVGPLAPDNMDDQPKLRDAVQTVTLLALRAVGVMDARARGLVVQAVLPAKTLVGV